MSEGQAKVGDRVRVHPACDWFMRGERYAQVAKVSRNGWLRVVGERSAKAFRLAWRDVLEVVEPCS